MIRDLEIYWGLGLNAKLSIRHPDGKHIASILQLTLSDISVASRIYTDAYRFWQPQNKLPDETTIVRLLVAVDKTTLTQHDQSAVRELRLKAHERSFVCLNRSRIKRNSADKNPRRHIILRKQRLRGLSEHRPMGLCHPPWLAFGRRTSRGRRHSILPTGNWNRRRASAKPLPTGFYAVATVLRNLRIKEKFKVVLEAAVHSLFF